jgi:hypothetical protein
VTRDLVQEVFGLRCRVTPDPVSHTPMVIPIGRHLNASLEGLPFEPTLHVPASSLEKRS